MTLQKFKQYLEDNPLAQTSKKVYYKAVKELLDSYPEPTIEQLNHFIAVKSGRRQPHVKYAIKKYLKFLGREQDYSQLHGAKIAEPIKDKVFLSKEQVAQIINSIKNPMHKAMAVCQYNTGTRVSEIITLRKSRISKQKINEIDTLRLNVRGKGNKPRYVYLLAHFWKYIEPYYNQSKDYIFMDKKGEPPITYLDLWNKVETAYKRYLESLKAAAKSCGFNISTHDLRRSFADDLRKETDIFHVQQTLGHKDISTTTKYLKVSNEDIAGSMLQHQKDFLESPHQEVP